VRAGQSWTRVAQAKTAASYRDGRS